MRGIRSAVIIVLVCVSGCGDAAKDGVITSPAAATHSAAPNSAAGNAKAKFHAKNHLDWVGRAHNKALDDFAAMVTAKGPPKNFCAALIDFMSAAERLPSENARTDATSRRATTVAGLRATGQCRGYFASIRSTAWLVAAAATDGLSEAATQLFARIEAANLAATSSSELAAYLTPILSEADPLEQADRDAVYAVASVAQASREYWEVEAEPLARTVDQTYGVCLGQYTDVVTALDVCMGIPNGGIVPTGYQGIDSTAPVYFSYVQQQSTNCESHMSGWSIAGSDIAGAIGGGMVGTFFTPIGTLLGAINGAGSASAINSWSSAGRVIQCRRSGGGSSRDSTKIVDQT